MTTTEQKPLPRGQQAALDQLHAFIGQHGYPPTLREASRDLGINISAVHQHWQALSRKGYVIWNPKSSRTIRIVEVQHAV